MTILSHNGLATALKGIYERAFFFAKNTSDSLCPTYWSQFSILPLNRKQKIVECHSDLLSLENWLKITFLILFPSLFFFLLCNSHLPIFFIATLYSQSFVRDEIAGALVEIFPLVICKGAFQFLRKNRQLPICLHSFFTARFNNNNN